MRLLVAGEFAWNCGSSHVIREYVRHASTAGMAIKLSSQFGSHDDEMLRELPYCDDLSWATHLLVVLEGNAFLTDQNLTTIARALPRSNRAVLDADAHWCPTVNVGTDSNAWPCGREAWRDQISAVSDLVLQPRAVAGCDGAVAFPYFGMPPAPNGAASTTATADVQYVGANWFRFPALVEVLRAARAALGDDAVLRVFGTYWDGSTRPGFEDGTHANVHTLESLGVHRGPPVPFGSVVSQMSASVLTPVLVRPVLSALRMLTPRMFETLAASTIPLYRAEDEYVGEIWQDRGAFCLGPEPVTRIAQIVGDLNEMRRVATDLREHMYSRYSYPAILRQLRELLG